MRVSSSAIRQSMQFWNRVSVGCSGFGSSCRIRVDRVLAVMMPVFAFLNILIC